MKLHLIKNDVAGENEPIELASFWDNITDETGLEYSSLIRAFNPYEELDHDWHYVGPGRVALTFFSYTLKSVYGVDQNMQAPVVNQVNREKETGTLYPAYNVTILPMGEFSVEEKEKHLIDALVAQVDYIKSGKILFDFRDYYSDMIYYRNRVHRLLADEYSDRDWDCYMYSYDNSEFE